MRMPVSIHGYHSNWMWFTTLQPACRLQNNNNSNSNNVNWNMLNFTFFYQHHQQCRDAHVRWTLFFFFSWIASLHHFCWMLQFLSNHLHPPQLPPPTASSSSLLLLSVVAWMAGLFGWLGVYYRDDDKKYFLNRGEWKIIITKEMKHEDDEEDLHWWAFPIHNNEHMRCHCYSYFFLLNWWMDGWQVANTTWMQEKQKANLKLLKKKLHPAFMQHNKYA